MRCRLFPLLIVVLPLIACNSPYENGMEAYNQGKWKEAIGYFEKEDKWSDNIEEAEEMIAKACFNIGKEAIEQKRWDEAVEYLYRVKDDNYEISRDMIGDVYYERGKEAFERKDWDSAIKSLILVRPTCSKYGDAKELAAKAKEMQKG